VGTTFEIAGASGHLGAVSMTPSNVEKFCADFSYFLEPGVLLTSMTATLEIIDSDAVVNRLSLSSDRKSAIWYMESPDDPLTYDLSFTITTNDGQTLNYTVQYNVGAPA
jgi:hypothetical protein